MGQTVHQTLKSPLKKHARQKIPDRKKKKKSCSSLQWSIPPVFNKYLVPLTVNTSSLKYGRPRKPPPSLQIQKTFVKTSLGLALVLLCQNQF